MKFYHSPGISLWLIFTNRQGRRLRDIRRDFKQNRLDLSEAMKEIMVMARVPFGEYCDYVCECGQGANCSWFDEEHGDCDLFQEILRTVPNPGTEHGVRVAKCEPCKAYNTQDECWAGRGE